MDEPVAAHADRAARHTWEPVMLNRPPLAERRVLKVVAFNAKSGRFITEIVQRLRRPPLDEADVILLSELDWRLRRSGRREVAAELAAELAMSFAYFGEFAIRPAVGAPVSFIGNAILSSRPLSDVRALPLSSFFLRRRVRRLLGAPAGISARIVVNGRPIALGIAHLNSRWNPSGRESQMTQYLRGFPKDGRAVIGGDFNTTTVDLRSPASFIKVTALCLMQPGRFRYPQRWEPLFERLSRAGFEIDGANANGKSTFTPGRLIPPVLRPKLDWLALRGLKPVPGSAAVVPARTSPLSKRFSDHDFVTCQVQL
jgi:endonuclease/exonuclease/phosphatase family metal-dependent hydrolase